MVSSFYSNNEKKLRKFVKENKIRELNQEEQQQVVDSQTTFELAKDVKAENLSKLASRVANKISSDLIPTNFNQTFTPLQNTPLQLLTDVIKKGQLTNLFNEMKALPDSELSATQKFIRDRLNDPQFKSLMNENIAEAAPSGNEAIATSIVQTMSNSKNPKETYDIVMKAISERGYSPALGREREKRGPKPKSEAEKIAKEVVRDIVKGALKERKLTPSEKALKEIEEEEKAAQPKVETKKKAKVRPV
jgi:hypothetical protein